MIDVVSDRSILGKREIGVLPTGVHFMAFQLQLGYSTKYRRLLAMKFIEPGLFDKHPLVYVKENNACSTARIVCYFYEYNLSKPQ